MIFPSVFRATPAASTASIAARVRKAAAPRPAIEVEARIAEHLGSHRISRHALAPPFRRFSSASTRGAAADIKRLRRANATIAPVSSAFRPPYAGTCKPTKRGAVERDAEPHVDRHQQRDLRRDLASKVGIRARPRAA